MLKQKKIAILILAFIGFFQSTPVLAHWSKIPGSTFPNTCAASMDFVPEGDASWDTHNEGKSYVFSEKYKNAISAWQTANLTSVTIANVSKDHLGLPIYVHKDAASAFTNFGNDLLNCEEIKQGLYPIEIFDNFACRLITGGKILSPHASGYAVDFNVNENDYTKTACKTDNCDFSPCFLAALKKNGLSWGGPGDPILFPGKCDTQHIQWTSNKTNIRESDLNFCSLKPEIAALYGAGTVLPTGQTVQSVTVDTGIPLINEVNLILEKPTPKISLPGLNFSEIKAVEEDGGKFLYIPFLGEYIAAAYKYGVIIASIIAVVMIINAGFGWAISGGEPEKINHAKTRIGQALVGLFLAVASYAILYIINPDLVKFKSLRVQYVQSIPLDGLEVGYFEPGATDSEINPLNLQKGSFSQIAFSQETCIDYKGFSLPTKEQRQQRLAHVLKTWKNVSIDQGGAIYSIGGRMNNGKCTNNGGEEYLGGFVAQAILLNSLKAKSGTAYITGLPFQAPYVNNSKSIPLSPPKGGTANCWDMLLNTVNLALKLPESERVQYTKDTTDSKTGLYRFGVKQFVSGGNSKACESSFKQLYSNLYSDIITATGRLCGDCGTFQERLLYNCFHKGIDGQYNFKNRGKKIFKITNKDDILTLRGQIGFGTILHLPGHWILFTGKSGDPQINYEIFEMGGGYAPKTGMSGEKKIRETFNPVYYISTVKINTDFTAYLSNVLSKKGSFDIEIADILNTSFTPVM